MRWIGRKDTQVLVLPVKGGSRIQIAIFLVGGIERPIDREIERVGRERERDRKKLGNIPIH